jgi:uncharacterized membrane protein YuzA (DUF378 family)
LTASTDDPYSHSRQNLDGFVRRGREMKKLDAVALLLVVVGALNWGLVALAEFDLVAALAGLDFGETNAFTRTVYGLVGISGVYVGARSFALVGGRERQMSGVV